MNGFKPFDPASVNGISVLVTLGFTTQVLELHDGTAGTETVVDFGTAANDFFDITPARIEVLKEINSVMVVSEMHVSKTTGGSDSQFTSWVEVSMDSGSTWTPLTNSLRVEVMSKDGETIFVNELSLNIPTPAGTFFRIKGTNTGAEAISILTPSDLTVSTGIATSFSTKLSIRVL